MKKTFDITMLGQAAWLLGTRISYLNGNIRIDQEKYTLDMLHKYGFENITIARVPMSTHEHQSEEENTQLLNKNEIALYLSMVGSLIYLSVISRPDILCSW